MNFKTSKDGRFIPNLTATDADKFYDVRHMLRLLAKAGIGGAQEAASQLTAVMESLNMPEERLDAYERARAKQGRQTLET